MTLCYRFLMMLITAAIALFSALTTSAQGIHVGVKAGANMGKIQGTRFRDGYQLGFHLGGFLEVPLGKTFTLQPEVLFNQSNTKVSDEIADIFSPSGHIRLSYLSIPLILRVNVTEVISFTAGPQYSILLNNEKSALRNVQNAFKKGDFSVASGVQFNIGSFRIIGRYNIGLTNLSDITNTGKWRSEQIQLGAGIAL